MLTKDMTPEAAADALEVLARLLESTPDGVLSTLESEVSQAYTHVFTTDRDGPVARRCRQLFGRLGRVQYELDTRAYGRPDPAKCPEPSECAGCWHCLPAPAAVLGGTN